MQALGACSLPSQPTLTSSTGPCFVRHRCEGVTSGGMRYVAPLTSLTQLDLSGCSNIGDVGLAALSPLATNLQQLDLGLCESLTDAGMAHLAAFTSLCVLSLEGCPEISDAGLAHIAQLTGLLSLGLGATAITDAGIACITRLSTLQSLGIGATDVSDAGLAHVAKLGALQSLGLGGCGEVTGAGLKHLTALKNLQARSDAPFWACLLVVLLRVQCAAAVSKRTLLADRLTPLTAHSLIIQY